MDIEWSKEGLWKLSPPSLSPPTPTLANLDYLLGQKPGFLSGPPLPILEIGESMGCPGPFPKPSVRVDLNITSAIMSVSLSHRPQELENALYSGGLRQGSPHPPSLLLLGLSSTGSFPLQNHITGTQRPPGNLSPT